MRTGTFCSPCSLAPLLPYYRATVPILYSHSIPTIVSRVPCPRRAHEPLGNKRAPQSIHTMYIHPSNLSYTYLHTNYPPHRYTHIFRAPEIYFSQIDAMLIISICHALASKIRMSTHAKIPKGQRAAAAAAHSRCMGDLLVRQPFPCRLSGCSLLAARCVCSGFFFVGGRAGIARAHLP